MCLCCRINPVSTTINSQTSSQWWGISTCVSYQLLALTSPQNNHRRKWFCLINLLKLAFYLKRMVFKWLLGYTLHHLLWENPWLYWEQPLLAYYTVKNDYVWLRFKTESPHPSVMDYLSHRCHLPDWSQCTHIIQTQQSHLCVAKKWLDVTAFSL